MAFGSTMPIGPRMNTADPMDTRIAFSPDAPLSAPASTMLRVAPALAPRARMEHFGMFSLRTLSTIWAPVPPPIPLIIAIVTTMHPSRPKGHTMEEAGQSRAAIPLLVFVPEMMGREGVAPGCSELDMTLLCDDLYANRALEGTPEADLALPRQAVPPLVFPDTPAVHRHFRHAASTSLGHPIDFRGWGSSIWFDSLTVKLLNHLGERR